MYLGMRAVGSTVYIPVTTHAQTGASVAPNSAFEAADFLLYKNGSATQRSSTAGWTITSPFDSITGLHFLAIDLSDNTDAGFYAAGAHYDLVLSPDETIDGLATVRVVAAFDIGVQPANVTQLLGTAWLIPGTAGTPDVNAKLWNGLTTVALPLIPATPGRSLVVDASGLADANMVKAGPTGSGTAQTAGDIIGDTNDLQTRLPAALGANGNLKADVRDFNGAAGTFASGRPEVNTTHWKGTTAATADSAGYPVVTVKDGTGQGEIALTSGKVDGVALVDTLTTYTGNTPQTGDVFPLASTEIADIKAKTDNLPSDPADESLIIAATDAILARLPTTLVSGRIDASVGAMAADVLTASALAASAVDEILDDTIGDGTLTVRQALRVLIAGMAGKLSGAATTTITIRNNADTADVIVATVDASGNRSAVTVTP